MPVQATMIADFMDGYELDLLYQKMRDHAVGGEKS